LTCLSNLKVFSSFALLHKKKALIGGLAHRLFLNKQTNEVYFDFVHYIRYLLILISIDDSAKILPITLV
jgi:hypothetical protein